MAGKFSIETIFKAVDRLSGPVRKMRAGMSAFGATASTALKGANRAVDAGLKGVSKFSDAIGIAGVASVAGLGFALKKTIEEGAQFERTMVFAAAQFPGMIRQGTQEFETLKRAALAVGEATEFSAQEAAEGLTLLATAGLSAEQAIAALPKVVNFAMASKVDFARASDIANDAMGAFSLTSQDAATNAANMSRVMDVLTRTAADSTTGVEELFEAVRMGGPIAKTAGASLEEFTAMTGILASVGIKGAEAGTAIRNAFLELGSPSTAAAKGMAKLGVKVAKTKDGAIDMTATIGRFAKATAKMTKAQKIQALGNVLGARTVGPFIALMDAGVDGIKEFQKNLENATGTTEGMAKVLQEDTLGAFRQFDSLISGVRLDVFDAIRPVLLDIVKATGDWVTANKDLIKTKATEWVVEIRDNLPKIWEWAVRIGKAFAGFAVFAATVKTINVAILGYEVAVKLASAATWLWSTAVKVTGGALKLAWLGTTRLTTAIVASRAATVVTTAATWLYHAAIRAGELANTRFTVSQVASKAAQLASRAATVVATAAQAAYSAVVTTSSAAVRGFTVAEVASKIAQLASRAATLVATAAQVAYKAVLAGTSGALGIFTAAASASLAPIAAQAAALAPLLIAVGAATAAVMGLVAAWNQYNNLNKDLAGSGGISGTIDKMRAMGTFNPFKAHDAVMNEKARDERLKKDLMARDLAAGEQPQIISPQARAAREAAEANAHAMVDGKITVEAAPGTKASVRSKPRSVPLELQPSGAF
jgi:TP901 family phage tail tape measure protein